MTEAFVSGDFAPGVREIGLVDDAFDFSREGDGLTEEMVAQLESIEADIVAGRISVPTNAGGDLVLQERGDLEAFTEFGTGTYTMEVLETPVTFTVEGAWSTRRVQRGLFVISTPDTEGPGDDDITFTRSTAMFDPITGEASLDANALETWMDLVPESVSVSEPTSTVVAGWDALTFDVVVSDAAECNIDDRYVCFAFVVAGHADRGGFHKGVIYRVAWIDHAEGPIVIVIGTTGSDPSWFETAWSVIETVELG